jgi:S-adenosylmethionine-diacylglycerol 3-amino-3-carboxypropyl transferase
VALPADHNLTAWVRDAASLPVAFAQVREDPILDARMVERLEPNARVLMIASGGCTLAYLAAGSRAAQIDVVDPNPAQLALARLKLYLLRRCDPTERLALLGHAPLAAAQREERLRSILGTLGVPAESIGPPHLWAADGPDHTGRYEHVFAALRKHLHAHSAPIEQLLSLRDPQEQAQRVAPGTVLGRALEDAFAEAMDLPILIRLFGEGATRNRVESFASHFAQRLRHVLGTLPAAENPYVWQVLAGRYPPGTPVPWLAEPIPTRIPEINWIPSVMAEALQRVHGAYDFVHLSNILDWLSPDEARTTLELAHAALRSNGWVLIRQLNSTLDIPKSGPGFEWHTTEAQALHACDRSYFYRALHLGKRS